VSNWWPRRQHPATSACTLPRGPSRPSRSAGRGVGRRAGDRPLAGVAIRTEHSFRPRTSLAWVEWDPAAGLLWCFGSTSSGALRARSWATAAWPQVAQWASTVEARLCRRAGGKHFLRLAGLLVGQPPAASPEIASWCRVQRAQRGAWRRPGAVTGAGAQWGGCDRFRDRNVSGSHDPQRRARRRRRDPQTDHGKQDSTAGMRLGSSRLAELRGRGCDQDVGASPSTSAKVCCAMRNAVLAAGTPQ
jgi:hypothetical protein